jgi:murein DD-endopeptidase / murein LD-carboxypeptidase
MSPAMICSRVTPVERARALLGTRFRLHGRDVASGLDCVGLIATVYMKCGEVSTGYSLRGGSDAQWISILDDFAKRRCGAAQPADIILCLAGPGQYHLGLWTGDSLIHADAGVGRVVETPGTVRWPIIAMWHHDQEQ